ncbi:very short patch repair endonuclease [Streptomyces yangpuensis]|uniref:very short patch repair endonuclease n=1 Tax=Streptomyces yangpuensis TaxID=1648182 RepID=UPI0036300AB5
MSGALPSSAAVSARMSRQASRDTAQEVAVRRLLHASGLRYRVNFPVPGIRRRTIDIAFTRARIAVFLDGCFWHGCPEHATHPKANAEWWRAKLEKNMSRDRETTAHLESAGWTVLRFWEHELPETVARAVALSRRQVGLPPKAMGPDGGPAGAAPEVRSTARDEAP